MHLKTFVFISALFLLPLLLPVSASADAPGGCECREQALINKLEQARQHNDSDRIRGLEEALGQVRRWCTDDSLRAKAEMKVMENREKVMERPAELDDVRRNGSVRKLKKLERKLKEAEQEWELAVEERNHLFR